MESPEPFGFEPFSDGSTDCDICGGKCGRSPQPFGIEPFSDLEFYWDLLTQRTQRSPQPFGFEPFSDILPTEFFANMMKLSPQPFGFEPFSDSGRYYSFILNILQECFGMGVFLFMNKR